MQSPTMKTPVSRCEELATYSSQMMSMITGNVVLADLATRMLAAGGSLTAAQTAYTTAVRAILPTRVVVRFQDRMSDRCVKRVHKRAQIADGKEGGPIATAAFPDGPAAITRLQGESQVQAMIALEGDLTAALPMWADAADARAEVAQHRAAYKAAVDARTTARNAARAQRALRDAEKQRFLATYEEIAGLITAQFPRDRDMQELFFDKIRGRSAEQVADSDEDLPEEEEATAPATA